MEATDQILIPKLTCKFIPTLKPKSSKPILCKRNPLLRKAIKSLSSIIHHAKPKFPSKPVHSSNLSLPMTIMSAGSFKSLTTPSFKPDHSKCCKTSRALPQVTITDPEYKKLMITKSLKTIPLKKLSTRKVLTERKPVSINYLNDFKTESGFSSISDSYNHRVPKYSDNY